MLSRPRAEFPDFVTLAGCAIVVEQGSRGLLADCPVWPLIVVVPAPTLQLFPRVFMAHEPVLIEALRAEASVERFNERIVRHDVTGALVCGKVRAA